jgi:hypothetical protein
MLKIELSLSDAIAIETMLLNGADALKASAREMDRLGLDIIAGHDRERAAKAERLSEALRRATAKAAQEA